MSAGQLLKIQDLFSVCRGCHWVKAVAQTCILRSATGYSCDCCCSQLDLGWASRLEPDRFNKVTLKLDHGWPESRTSQARSAQRCRMRSFSLHFVKQARDSTRQGALRKLVGASWSAQVALRKLHCASCSAQVAPRKLLRQVGPCKLLCANCAPCKLLCASCSVQVALCKLLCVSCSAQVALGKALCANWSVQVGLRKLLCATCSAQVALRKLL